jgi:hypothetical protein
MNRTLALAIAALSAAAAVSARADDITIDHTPFTSTLTRAEVVADMHRFRAAGLPPWAYGYDQLAHFRSAKTRQQVTAEFMASRAAVAAFNGEDSGSAYLAQHQQPWMPGGTMLATMQAE